jgi:hypothetical protein
VAQSAERYTRESNLRGKPVIVQSIIDEVRKAGGRFLKRDRHQRVSDRCVARCGLRTIDVSPMPQPIPIEVGRTECSGAEGQSKACHPRRCGRSGKEGETTKARTT